MLNFLLFFLTGILFIGSAQAQGASLLANLKVDTYPGFLVVMISSTISFALSILGTIYVFCRTFLRWKNNDYKSLAIAVRFPFYLAVTDFLLCFINLVNVVYTFVHDETLSGPMCKIIGAWSLGLGALNLGLVAALALATYYRVCRKGMFEFGRYDFKMFIAMFIIAAIMTIISAREFGQSQWWCGLRPNSKLTPTVLIAIITAIVVFIAFCYFCIVASIRQINHRMAGLKRSQQRPIQYESKVTRKIASYILIFLVQWGSNLLCLIIQLAGVRSYWLDAFEVIGISFGGIGNALQYLINEGWSKNKSTIHSSRETKETNGAELLGNIEITVMRDTIIEDSNPTSLTVSLQNHIIPE